MLREVEDRVSKSIQEFVPNSECSSLTLLFRRALDPQLHDVEAAKMLVEYARRELYAVPYRQVTRETRRLFSCSMLAHALAVAARISRVSDTESGPILQKVLKLVDTARIMTGCPEMESIVSDWIDRLQNHMSAWRQKYEPLKRFSPWISPICSTSGLLPAILAERFNSNRRELIEFNALNSPTLQQFRRELVDTPFIIRQGVEHWPACSSRAWSDVNYLCSFGADRIVPVEIGAKYTDDDWTQRLVPFHQFLQIVETSNSEDVSDSTQRAKIYLAQYDLHDTFPTFRNDICIPDYCYVLDGSSETNVSIHHWIGPCGTLTPLHYDEYRNFFAQVCGYKRVRLYAPSASVYPHDKDSLLFNTSRVDMAYIMSDNEAASSESAQQAIQKLMDDFPDFFANEYWDVIVGPGDLLYIPFGYWHCVRSLSRSISVSIWV